MKHGLSAERGDEGGKTQIKAQNLGPGLGIVDSGEQRGGEPIPVERRRVVLQGDLIAGTTPEIIPFGF